MRKHVAGEEPIRLAVEVFLETGGAANDSSSATLDVQPDQPVTISTGAVPTFWTDLAISSSAVLNGSARIVAATTTANLLCTALLVEVRPRGSSPACP
jgi:hypothetical protein